MNYNERLGDRYDEILERFQLASERISEIAVGENSDLDANLKVYFGKTANLLDYCSNLYKDIENGTMGEWSQEKLKEENHNYFAEVLPESYGSSYANPDYAAKELGDEFGKILCFLYTELRSERVFCFEQDLMKITILHELFLEIYGMFAGEKVAVKHLKETLYSYFYDYAEEWCGWRVRELLDSNLDFARNIIMDSDLTDTTYLYRYGEYISENEEEIAKYLNTLSQEEIDAIAATFTKGYKKGFELKNVDLSGKKTVNIRYPIGYERIIRQVIRQFADMGLESVIYRCAYNSLNKNPNGRIGYVSTSPNEQYEFDHRYDHALYLDKRMVDRKIDCMRKVYEEFQEAAAGFAGPALLQTFGAEPFSPISKENACRLSERQQNLSVEFSILSNDMLSDFINREESSFTIMAYPSPEIGENFKEIFSEMEKVNNLDTAKYEEIQQKLIDVLDRAEAVKIMGRRSNMTNLIISLQEVEDLEKQTCFENCLADVNIPLGEVFTSPKLEKTTGLLNVTESFLNGLYYKNLKIWLEDGKVTDYSCDNFNTEEEGKAYIKENILYNRETLPMGEFAIGTNTTAYVMAAKYGIMNKLPILIAEKMGPHMALGDTCYAYSEDVPVFNPDGREMIAKDNSWSIQRNENPNKAYFNCHTDITIPYEEIDRLTALMPDHNEIPIILDGRFILDGTLELNDPFVGGN